MFRTIHKIDIVALSCVGIVTTVDSIHNGKATNLVIAVFVLTGMWVMLRAAIDAIIDALLTVVDDAYDAGKDEKERRADVLDLAMRRKEGRP